MPFFARLASRLSGSGSLAWAATSDDAACPTSRQLYELGALTFRSSAINEVTSILEKRLRQGPRHWRNVVKALTVAKHLLIHGSPAMVQWAASSDALLETLVNNKIPKADHSKVVRDLAQQVRELVASPEKRLAEKQAYERARQQVRTSMGRSSTSRSTLDLVRNMDDEDAHAHAHLSRTAQRPSDVGRMSLSAELGAIQEEA